MELLLLDSVFGELGRVDDFESLQWTSRYYDVGSYKLILDISAFDLFMSAVYLYRPDSGQLAWIEDILYKVVTAASSSCRSPVGWSSRCWMIG